MSSRFILHHFQSVNEIDQLTRFISIRTRNIWSPWFQHRRHTLSRLLVFLMQSVIMLYWRFWFVNCLFILIFNFFLLAIYPRNFVYAFIFQNFKTWLQLTLTIGLWKFWQYVIPIVLLLFRFRLYRWVVLCSEKLAYPLRMVQ